MAGTMHPVLFVGCGGSGGVTLRFTMDALRAEVARWNDARAALEGEGARVSFGDRGLPSCWQFLHIDVPSTPDGNAADRPPSVPDQGGSYVSLAPSGFDYRTVSDQLWQKGRASSTRHLLSGWIKRPDPATDPGLAGGAGQMRNVGRVVTLYSLPKISEGLESAAQRLASAAATEDLSKLATLAGSQTSNEPVIFIVSSMSGGAGASMVLDVSRILTRLRPTWLGSTAMFLYTSEVFSELPENARTGIEANGLAAMGELLATSLGANGRREVSAADDDELRVAAHLESHHDENQMLASLGFAAGAGAESQTFRRVFPIGNTQGQRAAVFGDGSMDTVYRAIGRGLAGLVASPTALSEFVSYDMTNPNAITTHLDWLGGGGSSKQSVLWGNFGFGRLSLGRDRYGEYLAQRVAREAVDRLAGSSDMASAEHDMAATADAAYARFLEELGLPSGKQPVSGLALLGRKSGTQQAMADLASPVRQYLTEQIYQYPAVLRSEPRDFPTTVSRVCLDSGRKVMSQVNETGYALSHAWVQAFSVDVLRAVEAIAARHGLPAARHVVLRLREDTGRWSQALVAEAREFSPDGGSALPLPPNELLGQISKVPTLGPDHPLRAQVRDVHAQAVTKAAGGRISGQIGEALADFGERFAAPLARALQSAVGGLEAERSRATQGRGVADARVDVYAEWPSSEGNVPTRFRGAHNEVMLIDPDSFPGQVEADISVIQRARGLASIGEAREAMLFEILTDRWTGHNDDADRAVTLRSTTSWVAPGMVRDPDRPTAGSIASAAVFEVVSSPEAVLARSRRWVTRPTGELSPFLRQGIRGYLSEPDGVPSQRQLEELTRKFGVVLQHATPLLQVDSNAFGVVHEGVQLREMYKFSGIPLRDMPGGVATEVQRALEERGSVAPEAFEGFNAALDENATTDHIDVFGSYPPMSPLAMPSLLKPLSAAISRVAAAGTVTDFWRNRRARPLPGCLAMTPVERRSLIAGYVVGRMTGRLRGVYAQHPYERNEPLAVFFEGSDTWIPFPTPLLTPHVAGFESDEVAALLEAHLVAIAACGHDGSLTPLQPYRALRALYGRATDRLGREYDTTFGAERYLAKFVVNDEWVPGSGPRRAETGGQPGSALETAPERRDASLNYLKALAGAVSADFGGDDPSKSPRVEGMHYEIRPLLNSLAPDLLWALNRLQAVVADIDLTKSGDPGGLPTSPGIGVKF